MSMIAFDRIGSTAIVADGSIAVELLRRGFAERPPDRYNLTSPMVIEKIHRDFIDAGATLVQTNTFHANRYALEQWTLSARVTEINRKGVWIARTAANGSAMVAGVIGPTGHLLQPLGDLAPVDVLACYTEQATALVAGSCDLILLKGFIDLDELELAITAVRKVTATLPVIALKSFPEDGSILSGMFPTTVAERLTSHSIQAFGSNGTVGPQRMLGIVQALRVDATPLVALPDVGIPTMVDGTCVYDADPAYVASAAVRLVEHGASIIGAEGGATVDHVRAIAQAVAGINVGSHAQPRKTISSKLDLHSSPEPPTAFAEAIDTGFATTVELDIPRGTDMSSVINGARYLKEHGITAVNISDGARARLRMSPIAISRLVMDQTGMDCITHIACRDRNMVGLQSELLGAHAMGVRNILAVTGDPTHIGDFPVASSVYDVDSIGLIRALGRMNNGQDLLGNPLGQKLSFCISCAVNPIADDIDREIARLEQKVDNGATIAFSQPMFDAESVLAFTERIKHIKVKFMLGIIPLRTMRHAEFLHFEVPGMNIPTWVRERMAKAGPSTEHATEEGIAIAVELLHAVRNTIGGVYLMPPFKKYDVAVRILQA